MASQEESIYPSGHFHSVSVSGLDSRDRSRESVDISIIIPSYNRGEAVREAVKRCGLLRPRPREIIIVDDCSDEDSAMTLQGLENGNVKCIRLPKNQGIATARSVGFATARGKYLVSLDDDSWFLDIDALQRIWARLE